MSSKSNIYCCVPGCTQKGTVEPEGNRVGFFGLPTAMIVKIRRDVGPHFKLSGTTQVCSLHFYESDINKGRLSRHKSFLPYVIHVERAINKITNLRDFKTSFSLQRRSICSSSFCKFSFRNLVCSFRFVISASACWSCYFNDSYESVVILPSFR